jgi:hypothetical protein
MKSFSTIIPFLLGVSMWVYYSPELVDDKPFVFFLLIGVGFAKIAVKLIFAMSVAIQVFLIGPCDRGSFDRR